MPNSTIHPLLREGISELQSGIEKVLTVLGAALPETPLTDLVEKAAAAATEKAKPARKPAQKKAPESESGVTKEDLRVELQKLPRKVAIGLVEEYVPEGNAVISNVPVSAYDKFLAAIKKAQKEYPDK